jgi:hypothetical protein
MIYLAIDTLALPSPPRVGCLVWPSRDKLLLFAEHLQQLIGELRLALLPLERVG